MPRMIELVRASGVPSNLMQAASKGALPVPAPEMIEILVHLALHNQIFGQQARLTLAGWDEKSSLAVASDPHTPKQVLDYLIAPQNLRPALIPALLENPSIPEASLMELATSGSRSIIKHMLQSNRMKGSTALQNALRSNPNLTEAESAEIAGKLAPAGLPDVPVENIPATASDDVLAPVAAESPEVDEVLDTEISAYLSLHAKELESEGEKPFQPIGGMHELLEDAPASGGTQPSPVPAATAVKRAPVHKKTTLTHEDERGSALQKISKLDVKGRIQLAMKGTKEERSILVRDGTKLVALAVLDSPKISDSEVERFANQKNVLEAVLRGIPMKRRFMKNYAVVRNLVFNPRTPLDVSLGLMKNILVNDLRNLSGNKEVSETVRKLALKMFKQKADPSKKNTD